MPEGTDTGTTDGGTTTDDAGKTFTQEQVNAMLAADRRKTEARFADYDTLKTRAAEADASKGDVERLTERLTALETTNSTTRVEALRDKVARKHGITDDEQVELYLTGTTEEALTKQAKGLADLIAARKQRGGHVPGEGTTTTTPTSDDKREFVRGFFSGGGD